LKQIFKTDLYAYCSQQQDNTSFSINTNFWNCFYIIPAGEFFAGYAADRGLMNVAFKELKNLNKINAHRNIDPVL